MKKKNVLVGCSVIGVIAAILTSAYAVKRKNKMKCGTNVLESVFDTYKNFIGDNEFYTKQVIYKAENGELYLKNEYCIAGEIETKERPLTKRETISFTKYLAKIFDTANVVVDKSEENFRDYTYLKTTSNCIYSLDEEFSI